MIAHIAIVVRDYAEAIDFYTRALCFKLLRVGASVRVRRSIETQDGLEQHVRAAFDVARAREFLGRMAYPADARYENHADWPEIGHFLRIVSGAARHEPR